MKEDIYSAEWFQGHYNLQHEYRMLADAIHDNFDFETAIDVGCGVGFVMERLDEWKHVVIGIDGSKHAVEIAPPRIRNQIATADITELEPRIKYDLVICTEVAEHMPEQHADKLVSVLCQYALGPIFFTAATPGQGGNDHINEQPHEYWVRKFADNSFVLNGAVTETMRARLADECKGMHWFGKNTLVFNRLTYAVAS